VGKGKLIFLTLVRIDSLDERGIYQDLLRQFVKNNYHVTIICPIERRFGEKTRIIRRENYEILQVRTLNIQKTSFIEKGLGTLLIEFQLFNAIRFFFKDQKYDLILYSTPPITLIKPISYLKKKGGITYLLLKDIFPQNAVDLEMMKSGGLLHRFFEKKEKKLYELSDYIGCMSEANKEFLERHYNFLTDKKIEINPNSIELIDLPPKNYSVLEKHGIPINALKLIYSGNLGIPQGISFLKDTLIEFKNNKNTFFLIVGGGTEEHSLRGFIEKESFSNVKMIGNLPKSEFDELIVNCDIGLIFLDKRFTIPNFPSRLLSYLENKLPVISATDESTDIGLILEKTNSGKAVLSGNISKMKEAINYYLDCPQCLKNEGENGYNLLKTNFTADFSFNLIHQKVKITD
jgi:glycosyltransferase involved in cell wall biosynthesis